MTNITIYIGGGYLTHKDLANIRCLYLKEHPDPRRFGAREAAEQQRLEACEWLEKNKWYCVNIQVRLMKRNWNNFNVF